MYSLVSFLDPTIFGPLFRFNREFYEFDERGRPRGYRNLDELRARIRPLLLRRRKADVETELPNRAERTFLVPSATARDRPTRHTRGLSPASWPPTAADRSPTRSASV